MIISYHLYNMGVIHYFFRYSKNTIFKMKQKYQLSMNIHVYIGMVECLMQQWMEQNFQKANHLKIGMKVFHRMWILLPLGVQLLKKIFHLHKILIICFHQCNQLKIQLIIICLLRNLYIITCLLKKQFKIFLHKQKRV